MYMIYPGCTTPSSMHTGPCVSLRDAVECTGRGKAINHMGMVDRRDFCKRLLMLRMPRRRGFFFNLSVPGTARLYRLGYLEFLYYKLPVCT